MGSVSLKPVQAGSYLADLKSEGRLIKLADTIALLKEDEAGFTPAGLGGLF
jgi:hypothetical protein